MIKVLVATGAYAPEFSAGGLQTQAVAATLRGRADLRVLTTSTDAQLSARSRVEGVAVSRIYLDVASLASRGRAAIAMLAELINLVPRIDVVHVQGYSGKNILIAAIAKFCRRPLFLHLQTARHDEAATVKAKGRLAWWAFRSADRYLSVSRNLRDAYLSAGLASDRVRLVPNGVDPARFAPAAAEVTVSLRRALALPETRPIVLFVGVMRPDKQPDVLLDAWISLSTERRAGSTLVFVGATNPTLFELEGRLVDRMQAAVVAAAGLGGSVFFREPTPQVEDYFRAADVLVMPSAREGLPIVLLEGMACALPCLASLLPGSTDDIIKDGVTGRLVPPGDVRALAAALADVVGDLPAAARMGEAARRAILQRFTIAHVAEEWLATYRELATAR